MDIRNEPALIGQIVSALGLVGMFYPPIREAIEAVGGDAAFAAVIGTFVTFVGVLTRSRVTPV